MIYSKDFPTAVNVVAYPAMAERIVLNPAMPVEDLAGFVAAEMVHVALLMENTPALAAGETDIFAAGKHHVYRHLVNR